MNGYICFSNKDNSMYDLDILSWIVVAICAILIGFSKTGLPGLGILVAPLLASVFAARQSIGLMLGFLILADIFAAGYYRRHAQWKYIIYLIPTALAGIVVGYFLLKIVKDIQLKPIIGMVVLTMLAMNYWHNRRSETRIPTHWLFSAAVGFFAGVVTMMTNTAGAIMAIYLIAMRLPKAQFIGTAAWYFFVVNWLKVPFIANLELMTVESIKLNLMMLPFIAIGAVLGIIMLKRIPRKAFTVVIQILAATAAVKLLLF